MKKAMTKAPVFVLPDFSKRFVIEYDAIWSTVGAGLMQDQPIAFYSHALHGKHLLLSTYEKEMLPFVLAVQNWRPYLLGRKLLV